MRAPEAALAGLLHGPAELLPVSSSAHTALLAREPDRPLEVALHAGSAAALLLARWEEVRPRRIAIHLLAGGIPAVAGVAVGERRGSLTGGMLAGALALALADRAPQGHRELRLADGLLLGLAQALALFPGVSRNGATLTVARLRGWRRREANRLSREVGVPVTLGAAAYVLWRSRDEIEPAPLVVGALASFLAALATLPLLRVVDRVPLWPFAAYRAVLAVALVGRSAR